MPRLAKEADEIERQHPSLLLDVAATLAAVRTAKPSPEAWRQVGDAVAHFARRILEHETAEDRILQQGFNADPALFDLSNNR